MLIKKITSRFTSTTLKRSLLKMPVELSKLSKTEITNWLNGFDNILTDCDGVLWVYNDIIQNSDKVINKFVEMNKNVFFVTNNSTKTRQQFGQKARNLNFNVKPDFMISTAYLAAKYLAASNFSKKVYVIGSPAIGLELDSVNIKHVGIGPDPMILPFDELVRSFVPESGIGAVIVGFDEHFSLPKMMKAVTYLDKPDCIFIATNTDERFPMPGKVIPGTGSFVRSIETAAERAAIIMGKPNPAICEVLKKEYNIVPGRTLMIGDRCNTDILLGTNCGFETLLVGSGIHNLDDIAKYKESPNLSDKKLIPTYYLPKLGDLLPFLE